VSTRKRDVRFALMDAAFAADRKFVRLARLVSDPTEFAAAVGVFWLVLADARRARSPEIDWTEYEEYTTQLALLKECRLLTDTGFEPGTFERWAPAYRSPWDEKWVRSGTERYGSQRTTTDTSTHINSTLTNVNGNAREEQADTFMGWRPKDPEGGAGLWHGKGTHDGRHGQECGVCAPLLSSKKGDAA
jgi:hypothetical protein